MNALEFLLTTVVPSSSSGAAADGTTTGTTMLLNPVVMVILYCVVIFAVFYFMSIRPAKKRQKELTDMRDSNAVGDTDLTGTGFFGKVVDISYDCFIIDFGLNKSVNIPVLKSEIYGKQEPNLTNEAPVVEEQPKKKGLFK